jgi:hypothetical protein
MRLAHQRRSSYLLDQRAARRAAASLDALALSEQPQPGR